MRGKYSFISIFLIFLPMSGPPPHGKKNLVSPLEYEQRMKEEANLAEKGQGMGGGT